MPGTHPTPRRNEPIARHVRSLPPVPSIEYERKEAKALLKQIQGGVPHALRRVQATHPSAIRDRSPEKLRLADAQHVIAREYGFTSWPRMVAYFAELERHRNAPRHNSSDDGIGRFEEFAKAIARRHARGDPTVARELSHFVPRFYGRSTAEILATPITDDEARLVVARECRRASWDEMIERANASRARHERIRWEGENAPRARARTAMREQDIDALAALLDEHPELLSPTAIEREWRVSLAGMALYFERTSGSPGARSITDLLESRGVDIQRELDERLLGWVHDQRLISGDAAPGANPRARPQTEAVRWYLERGADPNWMPPNGIPILEHAIARYRDGGAVDLIAARVTPRRALWITAGLGDVAGVRGYVAAKGRLTPEGRRNRPDLMAMGCAEWTLDEEEADDLEVMWEAFRIAGWNGRWAAMDALLAAGLSVDHAPMGLPLMMEAVGNLLLPLADYLVSRGADLDRNWSPRASGSARSMARIMVQNLHDPDTEEVQRLLEICGAGTIREIVAGMEATRPSPPPLDDRTIRVLQLAMDDAARLRQSTVTTGNLLVGMLRIHGGTSIFMGTGTDMARLRAIIADRLLPDRDPLIGQGLRLDPIAEAALATGVAAADTHRRRAVGPLALLFGILSQDTGPAAHLLGEVCTNQAQLLDRVAGSL